uniref:Uncharacterized protein n=1 Tax=Plectus sambesii TaxID=2011161 RepID=A0A914WCV2_9BILA
MSNQQNANAARSNYGTDATHFRAVDCTAICDKFCKEALQNMLPEVLATITMCMGAMKPEIQDAWTTLFSVIASLVEEYRLEGEHEQNYRKGHGGHK